MKVAETLRELVRIASEMADELERIADLSEDRGHECPRIRQILNAWETAQRQQEL